ncbi:MAG: hypothetical protein LUI14_13480 [Lachnospiraceae bacterium]|nr:hypothetical protein [Lachnospiraceae bacterium]
MAKNIEKAAQAVEQMDIYLREKFALNDNEDSQKAKLWENTYIHHQIEKRQKHGTFTINEHIRGMVYSMLSSSVSWDRIAKGIDIETGRIKPIDDIFGDYSPEALLKSTPEELRDKIKDVNCASYSTRKQMEAMLYYNIPKLQAICRKYDGIDNYYESIIHADRSGFKTLITILSDAESDNKMIQLGDALTAEYLRNVGYDMPKPDRHIRRILGSEVLGCSDTETVSVFEAFDIIGEIAKAMNRQSAEVDYILWSYCADGYGEICTIQPKCSVCKVIEYCMKGR